MQSTDALLSALSQRAQHHWTEHGGCKIAWQQWPASSPDAVPLLLVHGGFGSWSHWVANIEALSERYAVWTLDLPGLGASGDLPKPWSTGQISEWVLAGWRELQGENRVFEVAGFSFGGIIAGILAAAAGSQCTRCILIGASGFGPLHVQAELLPPPDSEMDGADAREIHRENLARLMLHDPQRIDELAVYIHGDNLARHRLRSRGMAGSNDLADKLPFIAGRLVGIWGEHDATAGGQGNIESRRQLFLQAQPNAEFYVLAGVGHWAMYEAPSAVNSLILKQH
ncbi:MAG: alpha/beta fold hydrolase [Halioglobus sp.]